MNNALQPGAPATSTTALFGPKRFVRLNRLKPVFPTLLLLGLALQAAGSAAQNSVGTPAPEAAGRVWTSPPPGDPTRGAALYQARCTACHAIDSNETGPAHRGVLGRRVGSLPGYRYSEEMKRSRLRWTPQTLNLWLEDPEELVAGQRMGFQVDSAQERADLIAYLATLK